MQTGIATAIVVCHRYFMSKSMRRNDCFVRPRLRLVVDTLSVGVLHAACNALPRPRPRPAVMMHAWQHHGCLH